MLEFPGYTNLNDRTPFIKRGFNGAIACHWAAGFYANSYIRGYD